MCVDNFIVHAVTDGLARSHNETLPAWYDKRHVGSRYPAGLRSGHLSGRTVFFQLTGYRPFYYRRWIAAAGFTA